MPVILFSVVYMLFIRKKMIGCGINRDSALSELLGFTAMAEMGQKCGYGIDTVIMALAQFYDTVTAGKHCSFWIRRGGCLLYGIYCVNLEIPCKL